MATTKTAVQYTMHPDDEQGMQQFPNADHYVEHEGFPEWWEAEAMAQNANAPADASAPTHAPPPGMTNISDLLG